MHDLDELHLYLKGLDRLGQTSALLDGSGLPRELRSLVPPLPDDDIQISTTGKVGLQNIREAVDFNRAVMAQFGQWCGAVDAPDILDFGCGWGRITRAFLASTPPEHLYGVDVRQEIVDEAIKLLPQIHFSLIPTHAPMPQFAADSFDLIVGYSVFSHLSEDTAQGWINDFARILRPGGLVCITTRGRLHLLNAKSLAANSQDLSGHHLQYATMLSDFDTALAAYDAGKFIYVPTGGGGTLTKDFFGEAIIPPQYVQAHWTRDFDFVGWVDKFSAVGSQPIVVLQRK